MKELLLWKWYVVKFIHKKYPSQTRAWALPRMLDIGSTYGTAFAEDTEDTEDTEDSSNFLFI